jgi:tetratricopeptide (TPR) repeat protein
MKESVLKYLFFILSASLLIFMLFTSRDAGITCDEVLHYDHSVAVYNYFTSHGADKSSLNTPETNLKYYGQSYDNIVTILEKLFHVKNVYGFRHIMSPLAGWLAVLITAAFAIWMSGYRTGILVIILYAASPTFLGHSQNNLKDIPFALSYISGIFFTCKFLMSERKISSVNAILLMASIAFSISLRAGGLLLICYLFFFFFLFYLFRYLKGVSIDIVEIRRRLIWITGISVMAWFLSILLWPYALQGPISNVLESYRVMAHFPSTFRQIFEGDVEWSDFMPWYYLVKSMAITIPILVLAGIILFIVFSKSVFRSDKAFLCMIIAFTVLFPLIFVIYEKSNLYSSWRQFLFLYPSIVLLAATGFNSLFEFTGKIKYSKYAAGLIILVLSLHPLSYMIKNHRYSYIYYNQLVGGLRGAYGNYETDYYFVSQTEASGWLLDYLKEKKDSGKIKVGATYNIKWQFRDHPEIETSYFRNEERSMSDWDFAIIVNRYISPFKLKNRLWPPVDAIHVVYSDNVPVCAVLARRSKDDYNGYRALNEGKTEDAIKYFEEALKVDKSDEMVLYNYATALYTAGKVSEADSVLKAGLRLNPDFEPILMYLGNIARKQNKNDEAIMYYDRVIKANRKYFEAYVGMAQLLSAGDKVSARDLLRKCLMINPHYRPALTSLADTYKDTDPEIARKYYELADSTGK